MRNDARTAAPAPHFEAENQAMLRHYQAHACDVVRNLKGEVISAVMHYLDGSSEVVYHNGLSGPRPAPVYVTSSQLSAEQPDDAEPVEPS
jgi:hypothetical protein